MPNPFGALCFCEWCDVHSPPFKGVYPTEDCFIVAPSSYVLSECGGAAGQCAKKYEAPR